MVLYSLEQFDEHLDGLIFGHTEFVVQPCCVLGPFFGPLPELADVVSRERNDVLL